MIGVREINASIDMLERMMAALMSGPTSMVGSEGLALRRVVGDMLANASDLIQTGTIGTAVLGCFEQARLAGATVETMNRVRKVSMAETPIDAFGEAVQVSGVTFSFAQQCTMIAAMTFNSRSDVQALIKQMAAIVDDIKLFVCDILDGMHYQYVVHLSAALMQHLAYTERQLPRIVSYRMNISLPSLTLANRFYGDASRSDELIKENKTVHPAFMKQDVLALSE